MAEPTKAEILAEKEEILTELEENRIELAEMKAQYVDMKAKYESSPYATDANYQKEIQRLTKKLETTSGELKALRDKTEQEQYERDIIAADAARKEEEIRKQFGYSAEQNEHTRYRLLPQAPTGQRDIFGDPTSEVFDLGVDLQDYWGGVYIPTFVIVEMAQSIGMLTKDQADSLKTELALTNAKVEKAGTLSQELINGIQTNIDRFFVELDSVVLDNAESDEDESGSSGNNSSESETGTEISAADKLAAIRAKSAGSAES